MGSGARSVRFTDGFGLGFQRFVSTHFVLRMIDWDVKNMIIRNILYYEILDTYTSTGLSLGYQLHEPHLPE